MRALFLVLLLTVAAWGQAPMGTPVQSGTGGGGGGSGTVTTVSVVGANGFAGTVTNPTTTPAITLTTSINSPVLKGTGTALAASVSDTDFGAAPIYCNPITGTGAATWPDASTGSASGGPCNTFVMSPTAGNPYTSTAVAPANMTKGKTYKFVYNAPGSGGVIARPAGTPTNIVPFPLVATEQGSQTTVYLDYNGTNLVPPGNSTSTGICSQTSAPSTDTAGIGRTFCSSADSDYEYVSPNGGTYKMVQDIALATNKFITSIVSGIPILAQAAFTNLSGTIGASQMIGTSGGIPFFDSGSTWATSAALGANLPVFGGGAGVAPFTGTRQGNTTKVQTAGTNSGTLGASLCNDAGGSATTSGCSAGGGTAGSTIFSTTNSTTVTALTPTTLIGTTSGSTTVAVNTFAAGSVTEIVAQGFYSTPATPASLTIDLLIGGSIRITTGAVVQIASITNGVWSLRCAVTTRTSGASGTQIANCVFNGTGATLTPGEAPLFTNATWTIDTTATKVIDLQATWSTATGSPTITSTNVAAYLPGAPLNGVYNNQSNTYTTGNQNLASATNLILPQSAGAAPTTTGDLQVDTTQGKPVLGENSATVSLNRNICVVPSPGTTAGVAGNMLSADGGTYNTSSSTNASGGLTPFSSTCTIPANMLITGKRLRLTATFLYAATGSPPSLQGQVKLGSTAVMTGVSITGTPSITNRTASIIFMFDGTAAASASAPVEVSIIGNNNSVTPTNAFTQTVFPPASVATNGSLVISILVTFSAGTAGNYVQLRALYLEEIN